MRNKNDCRLLFASYRLAPVAYPLFFIACRLPPIVYRLSRVAQRLSNIPCRQMPITYHLSPISFAYRKLPVANPNRPSPIDYRGVAREGTRGVWMGQGGRNLHLMCIYIYMSISPDLSQSVERVRLH